MDLFKCFRPRDKLAAIIIKMDFSFYYTILFIIVSFL